MSRVQISYDPFYGVITTMEELKHMFIPKHTKISDSEKDELFNKYKVKLQNLPKISILDPAIVHLEPSVGDIIKIERDSETSGKSIFYRGVINE